MSRLCATTHSWKALLTGLAVATGGFGLALAQSTEGNETEATAATDGEFTAERRAALTPQQQRQEAGRVQQRGTELSRRVSTMLDEARQDRDIIRVTCVNDKLTQVNANLRTLEQRVTNLDDAIASQDSGRRNHEFTVITVLGQKFVVLDRESAQCVGQDLFETGSTRVTTEIDPNNPDDDPRNVPNVGAPVIPFVPPPASGVI